MMLKPLAFAMIAATALAGCKKDAPPPPPAAPPPAAAISGITLGKAIGANKTITAVKDTFALRDTLYVSVATSGTGRNQKLIAHWRRGTETVKDDSLMVDVAGPAVSEFHITPPRTWHAGAYSVTVSLNDAAAKSMEFVVR